MTKTSIIGFPHIGERRELKALVEEYHAGRLDAGKLREEAAALKKKHRRLIHDHSIDYIPSNDFFYYDPLLETAMMLNIVPARFRDAGLDELDTLFAMARGRQDARTDLKALDMKKWFNTNYHYVVPELDAETEIALTGGKVFDEYREARDSGIRSRPVIPGPFTLLGLLKSTGSTSKTLVAEALVRAYVGILEGLDALECEWVQIDEPQLVTDIEDRDIALFESIYDELLRHKGRCRILLQTYFGDVRDAYDALNRLPFNAIGLDLVEGIYNVDLIKQRGFPGDRSVVAGIVNGRNIWINDYEKSLGILRDIAAVIPPENIIIGTSCSLLHVPFSVRGEKAMDERFRRHLAFAVEKLDELGELSELFPLESPGKDERYRRNRALIDEKRCGGSIESAPIRSEVDRIGAGACSRSVSFSERSVIQRRALDLPALPTTTIGSFPQTEEIRKLRKGFRDGSISREEYNSRIHEKIEDIIRLQENIDLDVLVHGEFERNDMVEYFGENLEGFLHTENGWVQSYGTRCVKPPVIFGDIRRPAPITVDWIVYAQGLTNRPVKGMLTGPVTILNWSFPREDQGLAETAYQISLAVREEVLDLERAGIRIIQIDEAALREKLPLRHRERDAYLDWAIKAFQITCSGVRPETQIQTHMCYSEFSDIMDAIRRMDADVILIEAAKSDLSILSSFRSENYQGDVGPGVYDIHSPRIPGERELVDFILRMMEIIEPERLWINPDCGLKTRGFEETIPSLTHMVAAAKTVRSMIAAGGVARDIERREI